MAGKKKLEHFAEMKMFPHAFEPELDEVFRTDYKMKGNWRKEFFKNDNPLAVEFGCGKGEYSVGMSRKFPDKNFIGVDIKGARMWRGAKTAEEEGLKNIAFLRTRIEFIEGCFAASEVDEIWITFPDPQMKDRREKKRLTGPLFIERYKQFLKPDGIIHLKTDSDFFYKFSAEECESNGYEVLFKTDNLYKEGIQNFDADFQEILNIKTHYEQIFTEKGHNIHYLRFRPNAK
ncbi:tRNA (guanosine(46)-N7)-methyltransferase TrmB [Vicingaceae bacterium]|nr:tRNA (guanosine(46)-N7)-methyltransferase TrmB [Vicingaceae bacterium]MDB4082700.1 tRNA (guanosine(46)-N7)-methyltransferase TrmB [Vicingaceae bacterium]